MITYRYGPYEPEENSSWNLDKLMGVLSDMIMKYDIELEEALRMLIDRGMPVNLFLKEGGMEDLVKKYLDSLQEQINSILDKFTLKDALENLESEARDLSKAVEKKFKSDSMKERLKNALSDDSIDELLRLKWDLSKAGEEKPMRALSDLLQNREDYETISSGEKKYPFHGDEPLSVDEALELLEKLEDMEKLKEVLQNAIKNGDLFNFNLENLAKYLGPESYQEFLERRQQIFEKLTELLEKQGKIIRNEEDGTVSLSPESIRRIGKKALEEIFSQLKADTSGGLHLSEETGESENLSSKVKPLDFGDPISSMDISASILNAIIRTGEKKPNFRDIEIFQSRGSAKSCTVVLLDLSGSMMRSERFYNAKKVVMAMDSLIRQDYQNDRLMVVGFGTMAKMYNPSQIPELQPFPVTIFNPHIRLRVDMATAGEQDKEHIPLYFTNLQRGLQLSRTLLGSGETKNKQIILITDGVPTAHYEGSVLHINYPPSRSSWRWKGWLWFLSIHGI